MIKERTTYIDNIRVYLTILVILHHTAITYGAPGGWYYSEPNTSKLSVVLLTLFVATNQAFFMGFFFFLSSYFIPASYSRKGTKQFMSDRFKRLGIPLIFYSFVLAPVTIYLVLKFAEGATYSFLDYYITRSNWIDIGVLWFTAALLLFTICYWVYTKITPTPSPSQHLPSNRTIFLFALALGMISFLVRIVFPVGWSLQPLGFQLAYFPQYIALFIVGIIAYRNQWLASITYRKGIQWLRVALLLLVCGFPFMFVIKEVTNSPLSDFQGGMSWLSLLNCAWEQMMGIALVMAFLGIGKVKWNNQTPLLHAMARSAYAVYIVHPLVVVAVCLLIMNVNLAPGLKFLIAGTISVAVSFMVAQIMIKTPLIKDIV